MSQDETSLKSETDNNNVINDSEISEIFTVFTICEDLSKELSLMITFKSHYSFSKKSQ